ncbi:hypothetical protein E3N88_09032 [Mikania micrantha]|uniref:Legume lectin domain-containing protein n=1 Tax=Mikania micrantha TaxID=192012 RepID=A0A5N6PK76_9ASTR|nr:hypothetical protein E3N88_09032 [Mikania micrantha]
MNTTKQPSANLLLILTFFLQSPPSSPIDYIINSFNSERALYPQKSPPKTTRHLSPSRAPSSSPWNPQTTFFRATDMYSSSSLSPGSPIQIQLKILKLFSKSIDGNSSNHVFRVEIHVFRNEKFRDIDANHVGIDVNSLTFVNSSTAWYYADDQDGEFRILQLNSGNYHVWIDYEDFMINVTMAPVGVKSLPGF